MKEITPHVNDYIIVSKCIVPIYGPPDNTETFRVAAEDVLSIDEQANLVVFETQNGIKKINYAFFGPAVLAPDPADTKIRFGVILAEMVRLSNEYGSNEIIIGTDLLHAPQRILAASLDVEDIGLKDRRTGEFWFKWDNVYYLGWRTFDGLVIYLANDGTAQCQEFAADIDWFNRFY